MSNTCYYIIDCCMQIVTHIHNKEYGEDLDVEQMQLQELVSHTPVFEASIQNANKARIIPMTEEEGVEDMFLLLQRRRQYLSAVKEGRGQRGVDKPEAAFGRRSRQCRRSSSRF